MTRPPTGNPKTRWRTPSQQRIYAQKLLQSLKSINKAASQPFKVAHSLAIGQAADSALALTAGGQTRWSRAILARQWRNRKILPKARGKISEDDPGLCPSGPSPRLGQGVRERLRVLSGLVPGCWGLSALMLLEEAVDYVAALQLQVKVMRALADSLNSPAQNSGAEPWPDSL